MSRGSSDTLWVTISAWGPYHYFDLTSGLAARECWASS